MAHQSHHTEPASGIEQGYMEQQAKRRPTRRLSKEAIKNGAWSAIDRFKKAGFEMNS